MKVILPLAGFVLGSALFIGVNTAYAQRSDGSLVSKIADRFNVSEQEVQEVFEEHKAEKLEERKEMVSKKLQAKVDDRTITQEQKDALEVKLEEMHEQKRALKDQDLDKEEMKEQLQAIRGEFEAWAEENDISLQDVLPKKKGNGHHKGYRYDKPE